jgi:hypothetical protein
MNIIVTNDGVPAGIPATGMAKIILERIPKGYFGGLEFAKICNEVRSEIRSVVPERAPGKYSSVLVIFKDDTFIRCVWSPTGLDIETGTSRFIPTANMLDAPAAKH